MRLTDIHINQHWFRSSVMVCSRWPRSRTKWFPIENRSAWVRCLTRSRPVWMNHKTCHVSTSHFIPTSMADIVIGIVISLGCVNRLCLMNHSLDSISVVLSVTGLAREVLRSQPSDIYAFGAAYFDNLLKAKSGKIQRWNILYCDTTISALTERTFF